MIDALFSQPGYLAAQKMLDAAALRHEAIATNIANLETPNYKRVDISPGFSSELSRAISGGDTSALRAVQPSLSVDTSAAAANRDGNTVRLEDELLAMNQNQVMNSVETHLVSGTLLKLRLAITGRAT